MQNIHDYNKILQKMYNFYHFVFKHVHFSNFSIQCVCGGKLLHKFNFWGPQKNMKTYVLLHKIYLKFYNINTMWLVILIRQIVVHK